MKLLLAIAAALLMLPSQAKAACWQVPNGLNNTMLCDNGFWQTITPEGEVFTGNGMTDPNATARGSGLVVGGTMLGPTVTPPTQVLPLLEPYQAGSYGLPPRQD